MSDSKKLPADCIIDKYNVQALIDLYNNVPIAKIPEGWERIADDQLSKIDSSEEKAKVTLSDQELWGLPFAKGLIELTLPEYMQAFKTLVSLSWVIELGQELQKEVQKDMPPTSDDHGDWNIDEPYERWRKVKKIDKFIKWWPVLLGYNVLMGPNGTNNYQYVLSPLRTVVLHHVVREDLVFTMQPDLFGQALDCFMEYRTNN